MYQVFGGGQQLFLFGVVGHATVTEEEGVEGVQSGSFVFGVDLFNGNLNHVVEFVVGVGVIDVVHCGNSVDELYGKSSPS